VNSASAPGARILLIDGERKLQIFLRRALTAAGYVAEAADTGAEGLRLARSRQPDAILLELHLPDLSGHDVLARLRGFTQAPVIMLSHHAGDSDKIAALDAGAEDYVVKPFSTGELLARLRLALRRRHAAGSPAQILRWPGLDVDLARRRVAVNGKAVALTTKEWALLAMLARHPGRVMMHRELLHAVWGPAHLGSTQYLRVFMKSVRRKLGPAGGAIRTHIGAGYSIEDSALAEPADCAHNETE
jgi:two-component system KDP operon response regulator KdpE